MTEPTILDEGAVSVIEARAAKATPGPWTLFIGGAITAGQERHCVAKVEFPQLPASMTDGRFMAHAREDIPALCATVKHLRELAYLPKILPDDEELTFQEQGVRLLREKLELQSQLEQLRAIAEDALRFRVEMNGSCNHDEHMTKLCTQCEIRAALEKL